MTRILLAFFVLSAFTLKAQPVIKGGLEKFVTANNIYPRYSLHNCIQGTVIISFKVNKGGEVYESKVSSGIGTDLDDEALRLIRMSSGKWIVPQDHDTTVSLIAPIKFNLSGYDCDQKRPEDIKRAIIAYKTSEDLTNSIQNFYKNKEKGTYREDEEPRFVALKEELGYDDAYFKERISDGLKKIKQKDKQGACEDFLFVKYMGSNLANEMLEKYCK
ncbi:Gram-negative bacterial tonB protein [compost metagenome]|uniref:TonB family protein n=1 Tax=Pedobacter sp. ok626 TaxID=1761882 RepID=UPI0008917EF4|nr:TonB family protein [Pedobacter sp. ok626]SDL47020.1 TonB family C-terminal domain-containing protein [Pedobacter sp. ok626]